VIQHGVMDSRLKQDVGFAPRLGARAEIYAN
jgi:hypothetical protein